MDPKSKTTRGHELFSRKKRKQDTADFVRTEGTSHKVTR
jgi:hypothetical protein